MIYEKIIPLRERILELIKSDESKPPVGKFLRILKNTYIHCQIILANTSCILPPCFYPTEWFWLTCRPLLD